MSFPFEKCYNVEELKGYGITVDYDNLGNTAFVYKNTEIGYLLDIPGEPFQIATSFKINDCDYYLLNEQFKIEGIYKRERHWEKDEHGKTYLVKEKPLCWDNTTLSEVDFHDQLLARLIRAIEIYEAKMPILLEKFPWVVKYKKAHLSTDECIKHNLVLTPGATKLLNGNDALMSLITVQTEKISQHEDLEHSYWMVTVKEPQVTGIVDNKELLEYTKISYLVLNDRFTQGNKILMKLNANEIAALQVISMQGV